MYLGCTKIVQKAVCFVSVANRGLGPKSRFQKAKTPARWLALSGPGARLPKKYCTLGVVFCQWKVGSVFKKCSQEKYNRCQATWKMSRLPRFSCPPWNCRGFGAGAAGAQPMGLERERG